jgi:hypothetical protein
MPIFFSTSLSCRNWSPNYSVLVLIIIKLSCQNWCEPLRRFGVWNTFCTGVFFCKHLSISLSLCLFLSLPLSISLPLVLLLFSRRSTLSRMRRRHSGSINTYLKMTTSWITFTFTNKIVHIYIFHFPKT